MSIKDTTYGFPVVRAMQAEIDRLRAELAESQECELNVNRAMRKAIARVRELCSDTHCHSVDGLMYPSEVLRALDGGTE